MYLNNIYLNACGVKSTMTYVNIIGVIHIILCTIFIKNIMINYFLEIMTMCDICIIRYVNLQKYIYVKGVYTENIKYIHNCVNQLYVVLLSIKLLSGNRF